MGRVVVELRALGGRRAGILEATAIERSYRGDPMKGDLRLALDLQLKSGVVGRELADGQCCGQDAVLGVSAAAAGRIEMGDPGRRARVCAAVIEELVERGQAGPAAHEQGEQKESVHAVPQTPTHGKSLP
jgi:hypothetical protein